MPIVLSISMVVHLIRRPVRIERFEIDLVVVYPLVPRHHCFLLLVLVSHFLDYYTIILTKKTFNRYLWADIWVTIPVVVEK